VHSIRDGRLIFKVHVVPRSSRSEVAGEHNGSLRVRVSSPPVEGAANRELTQVLAKAFNVSRSAVSIVSGQNSRLKQVSIEGASSSALSELLRDI
jgi:uncharacterized protein (TIGR00251 family)